MILKFKRLHQDAVIPTKANKTDFCYDVTAVTEEEIAPNVWRYGLGFALQVSEPVTVGYITDDGGRVYKKPSIVSIDLRPRSSVWKTGMVLSNCTGTIDEGYTGEISAVFYHVMPSMPRYHVGDRIGQIKIGVTCDIEFIEVDELDSTERGANGYGSSGR